jgi:hypothetical protein
MAANIATDIQSQLCTDIDTILESIENKVKNEVSKLSDIDRLVADSCYSVILRSKGDISKTVSSCNNREEVLDTLSDIIDAFTNCSKCEQVQYFSAEDAQRVMLVWLSDIVTYFGKSVLVDAEVIILKSSDFMLLEGDSQYRYFESTLSKVRKWFKNLRKKLKPFMSP